MVNKKILTPLKKSLKSTSKKKRSARKSSAAVVIKPLYKKTYQRATSTKTKDLTKETSFIPYSPTAELLDENFIALAVWECLKNNDPDGVIEVVKAHLEAVNKTKAAKHADLPRSSLYNALKGKNPTIKTLAKLINCFS